MTNPQPERQPGCPGCGGITGCWCDEEPVRVIAKKLPTPKEILDAMEDK